MRLRSNRFEKTLSLLVALAFAIPPISASAEIKPLPNIDVVIPVPIVLPDLTPSPPKPEVPPTTSLRWSLPTGAKSYSSPVTAKDGTVYFLGNGNAGLLYALYPDGGKKWTYAWDALAYHARPGSGRYDLRRFGGRLSVRPEAGRNLAWKTELKEP